MVNTPDDWYPSYKAVDGSMTVEVIFTKLVSVKSDDPFKWRVCVWGEDDTGMEIDYTARKHAKNMYFKLVNMNSISKKQLEELGFVNA